MNEYEDVCESRQVPIAETLGNYPEVRQEVLTEPYDNEWVKLMSELSKNKSLTDLVSYINSVHWSRRQKKTLTAYCRVILSKGLSTTNFRSPNDYRMLIDDKDLIGCDLTVGLTRFDLTPEWNILIGMINYQFGISARMSKKGWFVERIGAQRHEIFNEERAREKDIGLKDKIGSSLGFTEERF